MSLLSAPAWLLVALLVLLVIILVGPERTYQRAVGLLQAFRGTNLDTQGSSDPSGESVRPRDAGTGGGSTGGDERTA